MTGNMFSVVTPMLPFCMICLSCYVYWSLCLGVPPALAGLQQPGLFANSVPNCLARPCRGSCLPCGWLWWLWLWPVVRALVTSGDTKVTVCLFYGIVPNVIVYIDIYYILALLYLPYSRLSLVVTMWLPWPSCRCLSLPMRLPVGMLLAACLSTRCARPA